MDDILGYYILFSLSVFWMLFGYIITMIVLIPYNLISLTLSIFIIGLLWKKTANRSRQLKRIDAITRSPIFTQIVNSMKGITQIRSLKY